VCFGPLDRHLEQLFMQRQRHINDAVVVVEDEDEEGHTTGPPDRVGSDTRPLKSPPNEYDAQFANFDYDAAMEIPQERSTTMNSDSHNNAGDITSTNKSVETNNIVDKTIHVRVRTLAQLKGEPPFNKLLEIDIPLTSTMLDLLDLVSNLSMNINPCC